MKTIAIDLTSLDDNFSGIERFAMSITKEIIKHRDNKYILIFKKKIHKEFANNLEGIDVSIINGKNKLIFNQLLLPLKLLTIKADYYIFPAFPAPFLFFNKKSIIAIHDVSCWDCPSSNKKHMTLYFKILYRKAALNNKRILTVSEFSKQRITSILKVNPRNILVTYNGLSDQFNNSDVCLNQVNEVKKKYNIPDNYLLCLSTLEPRKNIRLLVDAYIEMLEEKSVREDLVLAGRKGWLTDDLLIGLEEWKREKIHFTGFIDDEDLPIVYKNSKAFIFPSLYEGFGVPPIEAMGMGALVVSSNTTSLPEVLKDGAYYFENDNKNSLKNAIIQVINDDEAIHLERRNKGYKIASLYKWHDSAEKLLKWLY